MRACREGFALLTSRAVFLDRDGVIIEDVPYLSSTEKIKLISGAAQGIRLLNKLNFKVIIITNQSAVARGLVTEEELSEIHKELIRKLEDQGAKIDALYYCPHHPQGRIKQFRKVCVCRKPSPGMILKAAKEYSIDLGSSYMIGDKLSDVQSARKAGCIPILIDNNQAAKRNGLLIIQSLSKAATYIGKEIAA